MVLRYFLKKVPSQLIPHTGLCIQNVRHFLVTMTKNYKSSRNILAKI